MSYLGFDKVKEHRMWGVTNQNSSTRLTIGDSTGGTFTAKSNPLRGTLVWDDCLYVLHGVSVAGGATGGSYTITVETDALSGYTGLPIARALLVGPLTKTTVVMENLHASPGSPLPTHVNINQVATGGGIWFQMHAIAKQYRGTLSTPGGTAERVIQGTMLRGNSAGGFASDAGIAASATFTLGTTGSKVSLDKMRLWDRSFFWVQTGVSLSGTHDVNIVTKSLSLAGKTFTIASTGSTGNVSVASTRTAIRSTVGGLGPSPTQILWQVVSAGGVSDARVIVLAKSGRGTLAKE